MQRGVPYEWETYTCYFCNVQFGSYQTFTAHISQHANNISGQTVVETSNSNNVAKDSTFSRNCGSINSKSNENVEKFVDRIFSLLNSDTDDDSSSENVVEFPDISEVVKVVNFESDSFSSESSDSDSDFTPKPNRNKKFKRQKRSTSWKIGNAKGVTADPSKPATERQNSRIKGSDLKNLTECKENDLSSKLSSSQQKSDTLTCALDLRLNVEKSQEFSSQTQKPERSQATELVSQNSMRPVSAIRDVAHSNSTCSEMQNLVQKTLIPSSEEAQINFIPLCASPLQALSLFVQEFVSSNRNSVPESLSLLKSSQASTTHTQTTVLICPTSTHPSQPLTNIQASVHSDASIQTSLNFSKDSVDCVEVKFEKDMEIIKEHTNSVCETPVLKSDRPVETSRIETNNCSELSPLKDESSSDESEDSDETDDDNFPLLSSDSESDQKQECEALILTSVSPCEAHSLVNNYSFTYNEDIIIQSAPIEATAQPQMTSTHPITGVPVQASAELHPAVMNPFQSSVNPLQDLVQSYPLPMKPVQPSKNSSVHPHSASVQPMQSSLLKHSESVYSARVHHENELKTAEHLVLSSHDCASPVLNRVAIVDCPLIIPNGRPKRSVKKVVYYSSSDASDDDSDYVPSRKHNPCEASGTQHQAPVNREESSVQSHRTTMQFVQKSVSSVEQNQSLFPPSYSTQTPGADLHQISFYADTSTHATQNYPSSVCLFNTEDEIKNSTPNIFLPSSELESSSVSAATPQCTPLIDLKRLANETAVPSSEHINFPVPLTSSAPLIQTPSMSSSLITNAEESSNGISTLMPDRLPSSTPFSDQDSAASPDSSETIPADSSAVKEADLQSLSILNPTSCSEANTPESVAAINGNVSCKVAASEVLQQSKKSLVSFEPMNEDDYHQRNACCPPDCKFKHSEKCYVPCPRNDSHLQMSDYINSWKAMSAKFGSVEEAALIVLETIIEATSKEASRCIKRLLVNSNIGFSCSIDTVTNVYDSVVIRDKKEVKSVISHICCVCNGRFCDAYRLRQHLLVHAREEVNTSQLELDRDSFDCTIDRKKRRNNERIDNSKLRHNRYCYLCKKLFSCPFSNFRQHILMDMLVGSIVTFDDEKIKNDLQSECDEPMKDLQKCALVFALLFSLWQAMNFPANFIMRNQAHVHALPLYPEELKSAVIFLGLWSQLHTEADKFKHTIKKGRQVEIPKLQHSAETPDTTKIVLNTKNVDHQQLAKEMNIILRDNQNLCFSRDGTEIIGIENIHDADKTCPSSDHCRNSCNFEMCPVRRFSCLKCNLRSGSLDAMQRHFLRHSDNSRYMCTVCDKRFPRYFELYNHQRRHCTGAGALHKCSTCTKGFYTSRNLKEHEAIKHNIWTIKKHTCSDCGKVFTSHSNLDRHIRIAHTRDLPFECKECKKRVATKADLTQHIYHNHKTISITCEFCGVIFTQYVKYQRHLRTHSQLRNFKCSICSKTFFLLQTLEQHKLTHTGEQPFECADCGRKFNQKVSLSRHMRTHTGEKPYQCTGCKQYFSQLPTKGLCSTCLRRQRKKEQFGLLDD